jgi:hypothetical protein
MLTSFRPRAISTKAAEMAQRSAICNVEGAFGLKGSMGVVEIALLKPLDRLELDSNEGLVWLVLLRDIRIGHSGRWEWAELLHIFVLPSLGPIHSGEFPSKNWSRCTSRLREIQTCEPVCRVGLGRRPKSLFHRLSCGQCISTNRDALKN